MSLEKNKNLLLNQITNTENDKFSINEFIPPFSNNTPNIKFLTYDNSIKWTSIEGSNNISIIKNSNGDIIIDASIKNSLEDTEVYFKDGQIGVGGLPLHSYKVDIRVPENTRTTAFHIGDGVYGFSMGNATDDGFLPQIVGIGSDKDDAGFYILGKAAFDTDSNIPAIILDGRNLDNSPLDHRPILGITSGSYTDYKVLVDASGHVGIGSPPGIYKLKVNGPIRSTTIVCDTSYGVINLINEINDLKERLRILEEK